jgi:hypothetical protein
MGEGDQERSGSENADCQDIDPFPPEIIGQPGHQGNADKVEKDINGKDPRQVPFAYPDGLFNGRDGRPDDGDIQGAHQHPGEQKEKDRRVLFHVVSGIPC